MGGDPPLGYYKRGGADGSPTHTGSFLFSTLALALAPASLFFAPLSSVHCLHQFFSFLVSDLACFNGGFFFLLCPTPPVHIFLVLIAISLVLG